MDNQIPLFESEREILGKNTALMQAAQDTLLRLPNFDEKYAEAKLYKSNDFDIKNIDDSRTGFIDIVDGDVLDVAHEYEKFRPCVLNFASALHPGGGWLVGAVAQEEVITRRSTLFKSIDGNLMYARNKEHIDELPFYLDDMIYSPYVRVFKDRDLKVMDDWFNISVITAAAVNMRKAAPASIEKIDEVMLRRVEKVLKIAAVEGHKTIILGAWGCGAFGQDAGRVAGYFRSVLMEKGYVGCFDNIIFAIYNDQKKLQAFQSVFASETA